MSKSNAPRMCAGAPLNFVLKSLRAWPAKRLITVSLLLVAAVSIQTARAQVAGPRAATANGRLQGQVENGVRVFKGVPYALPPVGDLRWREPQPMTNWSGLRLADHFGPHPMQPKLWDDMIFRSKEMGEDCLYLNVWAPTTGTNLPVFFYIHGGGLIAGDGSELRYDGTVLARSGIVVVTINYRLGIFGFFAHPELTGESPHHASGNYGYLDQAAALQWVHDNIAAFGGDPAKVTIGGESAGSFSVSALMASPLSRGMFRGAVAESGSLLGNEQPSPLADGEKWGVEFARSVGAKHIADLRQMAADELLKASQNAHFNRKTIIDGYFFTEQPQAVFDAGRQAPVPLLAGWTAAEVDYHSLFDKKLPTPETFAKKLHELYGKRAGEALKFYPAGNADEALRSANTLAADRFIAYRTWKLVAEQAKTAPVFRYLWAQPTALKQGADVIASSAAPVPARHASELPYAFGALNLVTANHWSPADYKASQVLSGFFANFVKTGNPNGEGLPQWPAYRASAPNVMVIDADPQAVVSADGPRYEFLDAK